MHPASVRSLSAGEYRAAGLKARRWADICLDAGEPEEARHQINEAARMFALADEIDMEKAA